MADDEGVNRSDDELAALILRLNQAYSQAAYELTVKYKKYMADFIRKDTQKQQDLAAGLITEDEYKRWRLGQILIGHRWQEMVDTMTADLVKVDQFAMAMVSDTSLDVFAVNHNYATFEVEQGSNLNTSYTLYNRDAVAQLVRDNPQLLPLPSVNIPKDQVWNRQHLASAILQGIMQGESIGEIATRVQGVAEMDRKAALRNARTMVTCAQNSGRQAAYERGESKGIHGVKQWVAAHDERVRASHAAIDGEQVAVDKPFSNGLMFPGDKNGAPAEVYNCRCAMAYRVGKVDLSAYVKNKPEEQMSYGQWVNEHASEDSRKATPGEHGVNWPKVQGEEYKKAFRDLIGDDNVADALVTRATWALSNRNGTNTEEIYAVFASGDRAGNELARITDQHIPFGVKRTKTFDDALKEAQNNGDSVILLHNHPNGTPPSVSDINGLYDTSGVSGITVGHSGSLYYYTKPAIELSEEDFNNAYGYYYSISRDEILAHERALEELKDKYGFSWQRLL